VPQTGQNATRIDDCRLMIVDLRCELENERSLQASSLQKSTINIHQSAINPVLKNLTHSQRLLVFKDSSAEFA
jgi:hypothetical protein